MSILDITIEDICAMAIWFGTSPAQMNYEWQQLNLAERIEIFKLFSEQVYA